MSPPVPRIAVLSLLGALALAGCGLGSSAGPASKAPGPVAIGQLPARQDQLLDGGVTAFKRQLAALRGHPVVVNQWASWCGPCKFEFPFFARLASRYRGRVAFLGVDSMDNGGDAVQFLAVHRVPYPSFEDPDASVARVFGGGRAWPTTAFYDARGKLAKTHFGAYATQAKLDDDIRTHALR